MAKSKSSPVSWARTHGGVVATSAGPGATGPVSIRGKSEERADIRQLFVNELGFKDIVGTQNTPTAQLAALGIALKKLESEHGVISRGNVTFGVTSNKHAKGMTVVAKDGSMALLINPSIQSSVSGYRKALKSEISSGFKTPTDNRIINDFSYTARHEYGHLMQFQMMNNSGKSASQISTDVRNIAVKQLHAKNPSPSSYGSYNDYEYFAESFASMTGGLPGLHGQALSIYLNKQK